MWGLFAAFVVFLVFVNLFDHIVPSSANLLFGEPHLKAVACLFAGFVAFMLTLQAISLYAELNELQYIRRISLIVFWVLFGFGLAKSFQIKISGDFTSSNFEFINIGVGSLGFLWVSLAFMVLTTIIHTVASIYMKVKGLNRGGL
ncbi:MAG: hypothetical protein CML31_01625 [Rhizobiales bacterium]|nr:hypothetical protein [Hyphomicrobiales bacterium]